MVCGVHQLRTSCQGIIKPIPGSSFVFLLRAQDKILLFYNHYKTAKISCFICSSAPAPRCPATSSHHLHWFNVTVRVKPINCYGGRRSSFCNPDFGTFFNLAALLYEYTELIPGFHHTFWASVFADKWIRKSDAHIRCNGNHPCEGQYVLLWAYGTQNFLIFITFICYNKYGAVVYTLNMVSV